LTSSRPNTSSNGFISGEFDCDKTEEVLAQVKASKNTTGKRAQVNQHSTKVEGKNGLTTEQKTAMVCSHIQDPDHGLNHQCRWVL
jgi:hypothetical protein